MNPSKYAFQAGLFILLSIAAAIFLVARVAESRSAPADAKTYTAVFPAGEDVGGLSEGAEVRLLGVKVGRVDSVDVAPPKTANEDATVRVRFSVGNGVELRQTAPRVELQTAVTGGAWLNILSVGTGAPLAENGEVNGTTANLLAMIGDVRDEMNTTLTTVRGEIDEVSDEMQLTLAAVREDLDTVSAELVQTADSIETSANEATALIDKVEKDIDPIIKDVDTFLAEATGVMTDVRGVFGDSGEDIRKTLANINSITTKLDTQLPETLAEINDFVASAEGFVERAQTSLDGTDELIAELTGTTADARAMLAENRPTIDRTMQSAQRSVDELEGLIDDLRANPSRLVWPPDEKDLNNLELYATARSYAKAAEDLQSAAAALREASLNETADPDKLDALRKDLMQQFEHFDQLQAEVWERFEK
ncbi:MAG: MlaD family protein [Phycisphaeraceae bacterium]